jgi:hypothetical protein
MTIGRGSSGSLRLALGGAGGGSFVAGGAGQRAWVFFGGLCSGGEKLRVLSGD